jgi:hypothetical protein
MALCVIKHIYKRALIKQFNIFIYNGWMSLWSSGQRSGFTDSGHGVLDEPKKTRLRVFENRVLRRIFGSRRDEVTGG